MAVWLQAKVCDRWHGL